MSYQQNPLLNHPHFRKIKDLNEGTFGFVQLATDTRKNEPVRLQLFTKITARLALHCWQRIMHSANILYSIISSLLYFASTRNPLRSPVLCLLSVMPTPGRYKDIKYRHTWWHNSSPESRAAPSQHWMCLPSTVWTGYR